MPAYIDPTQQRMLERLFAASDPYTQMTESKLGELPMRTAPQQLPAPVKPMAMQRPPGKKTGIFDKLFGAGIPAGLLTDADKKSALRNALMMAGLSTMQAGAQGQNIGAALSGGLLQGLQAGQQGAMGMVQSKLFDEDRQKKLAVESQRQAIYEKYPAPADEKPADMLRRYARMLPEFMRMGDTEMVGKLTELLKSAPDEVWGGAGKEPKAPERVQGIGPDGNKYYFERQPDGQWKNTGLQADVKEPAGPNGVEQQRMFTREMKIMDGWADDSKKIREVYDLVNNATREEGRALAGDPAAQINFLYAFIRALDPNSVVREGEVRLFEAARPFWDEMSRKYQEYTEKGKAVALTPREIKSLSSYLSRSAGAYARGYNRIRGKYEKQATRWKVPLDVLDDPLPVPRDPDPGNVDAILGGGPSAVGPASVPGAHRDFMPPMPRRP